jgi:hypothetical protein
MTGECHNYKTTTPVVNSGPEVLGRLPIRSGECPLDSLEGYLSSGEQMHRELKKLLRSATGDSAFVLAVNIDIRGFTKFFKDSTQAAEFLANAYSNILALYFPKVDFFKPTGDGLLLVKVVAKNRIQPTLQAFVDASLLLNLEFYKICESSVLINYETPEHVGIGLAWGTATRISSKGKTLDFSGRPLNLASRLMDLARPSGVVFDSSFKPELLDEEVRQRFEESVAYLKGIADLSPLTIYTTPGIQIPDINRKPFGAELFFDVKHEMTLQQIIDGAPRYMFRMSQVPSDENSVSITIDTPATQPNGNKHKSMRKFMDFNAVSVEDGADGKLAEFDFDEVKSVLAAWGVKPSWPVTAQLKYAVPFGTAASVDSKIDSA